MLVRIVSGVKRAAGKLPFVQTEVSERHKGPTRKSFLDEEDVDMYIANGDSAESSEFASNCLLCEVCLRACPFPVEPDDVGVGIHAIVNPPSDAQLDRLRRSSPALMCSGCSMVVHADCVEASDFTDRAILHHLSRTECDWFCGRCVAAPTKHALRFGYQLGEEMTRCEFEKIGTHTLTKLGLGKPSTKSVESVERAFWKIVNCDQTNAGLSVLYGSDLDSQAVSAGSFPASYDSSGWDPRYLPLNGESVLKHLPGAAEITGVSRPWMYLGSPLSAFCWHAEDQFLCSISYLHEGASKVWYTVPGGQRDRIEAAISSLLPDLETVNIDLHHQLVTLVDPHVLHSEFRVPVGRAVQNAGQFMVTFPQAYHCGFNSGNNLAEAVNVACPDWLPHGRLSIAAYADVKRPSVFSLEELAWHMTAAVCAGQDTRRPIASFCLDVLTDVIALAGRVTLDGKVATECMRYSKMIACEKCNQFSYLLACRYGDSLMCGYCATERPDSVLLRHSLEDVEEAVTDLTGFFREQCGEVRRSERASKRSRFE
jgi:hypothetical protein